MDEACFRVENIFTENFTVFYVKKCLLQLETKKFTSRLCVYRLVFLNMLKICESSTILTRKIEPDSA